MSPNYSRYYVYIKPVIKNPYIRAYGTVILSLVAITFFSIFAIRPTLKTIVTLQKDIKTQSGILNQLTIKSGNLESAINNYNSLDSESLRKLNSLIPNKITLGPLVGNLSSLAQQNQASISGLQFHPFDIDLTQTPPQKETELREVSFAFNVSGPYESLVKVLDAISFSNHLIIINSVSFNKNETGISMTVSGKTYY